MVQSKDIPMVMTSDLCQEILRVQIDLSFSYWMENKRSPSYHDLCHSSRRCTYHGLHIQVCLIHGLVIILGCHIMIISFIFYQGAMICIIDRIGRLKIFVIEHAKECKAEIVC